MSPNCSMTSWDNTAVLNHTYEKNLFPLYPCEVSLAKLATTTSCPCTFGMHSTLLSYKVPGKTVKFLFLPSLLQPDQVIPSTHHMFPRGPSTHSLLLSDVLPEWGRWKLTQNLPQTLVNARQKGINSSWLYILVNTAQSLLVFIMILTHVQPAAYQVLLVLLGKAAP